VAAVAFTLFLFFKKRRTQRLRQQFGPEYERTLKTAGDQRRAEAELAHRQKRVESLKLHELRPEERQSFADGWHATQARFVDEPSAAVQEADDLVKQVMQARGYPMGDFEQRAADISVDHPKVVQNYRAARDIALRNRKGEATTEDLRQAFVYYRQLFEDLLGASAAKRTVERRELEKESVR